MTREEAIKHLETYSTTNGSGQTTQAQHEEAKRMGIKALEQEPCGDVISRQAVINLLQDAKEQGIIQITVPYLEGIIEQLPPVNPQPKTGHWEQYGDPWEDKFKCSECGKEQPKILCCERIIGHWSDYCPNCGARMIEPQGSEDEA